MVNWLAVTNYENWEIVKSKKVWGVKERYRNTTSRIRKGDRIVFYISQKREIEDCHPAAIGGSFEVIREMYIDKKPVFFALKDGDTEVFPLRIDLVPVKTFHPPCPFVEFLPKLSFIKNKKFWTGYLRGSMKIISDRDYEKIFGK